MSIPFIPIELPPDDIIPQGEMEIEERLEEVSSPLQLQSYPKAEEEYVDVCIEELNFASTGRPGRGKDSLYIFYRNILQKVRLKKEENRTLKPQEIEYLLNFKLDDQYIFSEENRGNIYSLIGAISSNSFWDTHRTLESIRQGEERILENYIWEFPNFRSETIVRNQKVHILEHHRYIKEGVYQCRRCSSKKTRCSSMQLRSGDEGETQIIKCMECGAVETSNK